MLFLRFLFGLFELYKYRLLLTDFSTQRCIHILDIVLWLTSLFPDFPFSIERGKLRSTAAVSRCNLRPTTWLSFQEHPAQTSKRFWNIWASPPPLWPEYSVQFLSQPPWGTVSPLPPEGTFCRYLPATAVWLSQCGGAVGKEGRGVKCTWGRCCKHLGSHCCVLGMWLWRMWGPAEGGSVG